MLAFRNDHNNRCEPIELVDSSAFDEEVVGDEDHHEFDDRPWFDRVQRFIELVVYEQDECESGDEFVLVFTQNELEELAVIAVQLITNEDEDFTECDQVVRFFSSMFVHALVEAASGEYGIEVGYYQPDDERYFPSESEEVAHEYGCVPALCIRF